MEINHTLLSEEVLDGLLSEVVLREGTDYGNSEVGFDAKKAQLLAKLERGRAVILFDPETNECNILMRD